MKKLLLIVGIVSVVACVIFLAFALLNLTVYNNLYDGAAELYDRLHQRMIVNFIIGILLAIIGAVCFIIRSKI